VYAKIACELVIVDSSLDDLITTIDNTIPDTFTHDQSTCDDFTQITSDDESQPLSKTREQFFTLILSYL